MNAFNLPSTTSPVLRWVVHLVALMALGAVALAAYAVLVLMPGLPTLEAVTDYRPKLPLRVYTADNVLIGEFGQERRDFVPIAETPAVLKNALLSIEDARFYSHGGVDFIGLARAFSGVACARAHPPSPCRWRAIFT
jgi:penicillin-binding protein 1A